MKTKNLTTFPLMTFFLVTLITSTTFAQDTVEIIRRMEQNMRGDASYTEMSMEVVRPRYTREISMRTWALGDDYSLVYVTAPARDEGTAFLKIGNEIWNYQPNIDRTVKMPPSMMSQSWMGSDFTNDDLVNATSLVDDYTHELLGEEEIDGHACYLVELLPKPDNPIVYEKVLQWVSKEHYLPVRTENYDERDQLVSTIHFREIKTLGGRKIPSIMEMVPENNGDQKTIITTHEADYDIDIEEDFFSIENLTEIN